MMPAAKHGDPQLGVDIHLCVVPPSPSPVPLPTPHISVVFDPFDYVPYIGATVTVCGMKRATAGTSGTVVHIPPGFPFAPKLPDKDDELFMGSSTVVADGDPFSFIAVPVLGCQVAGMISIPRLKKKGSGKKLCLLPTTFNLAIPTTVFVGGPPTISLMGMAFKGAFAALGKFAKSGLFKRIRQKLFGNLKPGFLKCKILRAEPVNILTGEVSVEQEDFTLPGRIPIEWCRSYTSGSTREGLCGYGWETPADTRLEIDPVDGVVSLRHPTVGPLFFAQLPTATGEQAGELEMVDGARLTDHGDEYRVRTKEDRIYHFPKALAHVSELGCLEYPIGRFADLCGNWLNFDRRSGTLTGITESTGRRVELRSSDGRIREVMLRMPGTDVEHTFVRYEYDASGDLIAVIDALGHPYRFEYDKHHLIRHTDRNGLSFYYEYDKRDEDWRVTHSWGDGGLYDYSFEYLDELNERRITDSHGHLSVVTLDTRGLPICEIDALGGRTIYEYDEAGRTTAVVDAAGRTTAFEYDERGNLLKETRPDGACTQTEFDENSKSIRAIDPNGSVWTRKWDARGLLLEETSPLHAVSRYEYDSLGRLAAFVNRLGAVTRLSFDALNNVSQVTDALGHRTSFIYDALGNVEQRIDPLNRVTLYGYDRKSRLISVARPSGACNTFGYDPEDNVTSHVDENGAETRFEYCGLGELARRIQPDRRVLEYCYDTEERLIGVRNQRGELYELRRDELGRIVEEIDYWRHARRYGYDAGGHLRTATDPLGQTTSYVTDLLGRIVKKLLPDGRQEAFIYDANGNVLEVANAHTTVAREFDAENRLLREAQDGGFTIENVYDAVGNRVRRTTSLGSRVDYEFDALNQIVAVRIDDGEQVHIQHDAVGQITQEVLTPGVHRRFGYDVDGLLIEQVTSSYDGPQFATRYGYDGVGNLTYRSDTHHGPESLVYDLLGRVVEHTDPEGRIKRCLYDAAGDRFTRVVQPRSPREDEQSSDAADIWVREYHLDGTYYRFDSCGNLVERCSGGDALHLEWDANQRLVESRTGATRTRYGYDPYGRRLFKETDGIRTLFFWDGDALAGEVTVAPHEPAHVWSAREYVYYPETFEPLALLVTDSNGSEILHYHNEPNGAPCRLTDASGDSRWAATYTAWGAIATQRICNVTNPLRLQGQYEDDETGLRYNRNRYFDAVTGSFISQDPLGIVAAENLYGYAPNVWRWDDPLGLKCKGAKRGPKTDPKAPHNAKIREVAAAIKPPDKVVAGGGVAPERLIDTPGGHKGGRRPDVLVERPDGSLYAINVGKTKADGTAVPREIKALEDLNDKAGIPTTFVAYDR